MFEKKIYSLQEYLQFTDKYKGECYFRGQADCNWKVEPSIFRDAEKLKNEGSLMNLDREKEVGEQAKEILRLQHFAIATRLCDVTVNPEVGLYFVFDCDDKDKVDGCVYVYKKENEIQFNSSEMNILLTICANEIHTMDALEERLKQRNIAIETDKLEKLVTENHLVKYDREFSWSNNRAYLQGGTGIFFGFSLNGREIEPKGTLRVDELAGKIIIPSEAKNRIKEELNAIGINGEVLYNKNKMRKSKLTYTINEKRDWSKKAFAKVIVYVRISESTFNETEILRLTNKIWKKMKRKYGTDSRVFLYLYYDEQDKRIGNWILRTQLKDGDCQKYEAVYNKNYYFKRMDYLNEEISFEEIYCNLEPIIFECKGIFDVLERWRREYENSQISLAIYKERLSKVQTNLWNLLEDRMQVIGHGQNRYDEYYHNGGTFCEEIHTIIWEQLIYIGNGEEKYSILQAYQRCLCRIQKYWQNYQLAKRELKEDIMNISLKRKAMVFHRISMSKVQLRKLRNL